MIEFIILCILFIIIVVICFGIKSSTVCVKDDSYFPELNIFNKYKDLLNYDLEQSIKSYNWTDLNSILESEEKQNLIPKKADLSKIDTESRVTLIRNNFEPLPLHSRTMKHFFLIYGNRIIKENSSLCKNMMSLIGALPGVVAAYIRCIKPNTVAIDTHLFDSTLVCNIPLSVVEEKEGIEINDVVYKFADLMKGKDFLITDSKCSMKIWNLTAFNKYVLCIVIKNNLS